jgi:RNase H-fold protein (predicted Holliday junction resolvase)
VTEKILGLDIGDKYVGIAVSDALGVTAQGYRTYKKADRNADLAFFGCRRIWMAGRLRKREKPKIIVIS